ncbi:MAG: PAS domain S-box protein [Thermodesulfovibrionales bacterium]
MRGKDKAKKPSLATFASSEKRNSSLGDALYESEEKYRFIVENTNDLIMLTLPDGKISFLSRACENVLGYAPEDLFGKQPSICHPEDLEKVEEMHRRALKGESGSTLEYRVITEAGRTKWVSHSWSPIIKGNELQMIVSVVRDITERKEAEYALNYQLEFGKLITVISRNFLSLSQEQIDSGVTDTLRAIGEFIGVDHGYVFLFSHDERSLENTHAWLSEKVSAHTHPFKILSLDNFPFFMKKLSQFEALFIPSPECLPSEAQAERQILLAHDVKTLVAIPLVYNQSLIGFLWFDATTTNISCSEEIASLLKVVAQIVVSAIMHNKMEEDLFMAKKYESIGLLVEGIANDFSNLLNDMAGHIYMAKGHVKQETKVYKILSSAEHAAYLAKDLMTQLRAIATMRQALRRSVNITHLIEDSANFAVSTSNVRCYFQIADDLWPVCVNEDQIRQVIHNIIVNAKEAISGKGILRLSAENITQKGDYDLPLKEGNYIKISIEDRGIGIPGVNLQKIFDPYFTTKDVGDQKGTGLGLTTCYAIIKSHGGFISVESKMGIGTTFHMYLPAASEEILTDQDNKKISQSTGRILVMDDEEIDRSIAAEMLKHLCFEVELARNGEEAIELYKKREESGQPFDALILDLTITRGMGGKETIENLLKIDPLVKAIVCSGYSNDVIFANFRDYGFSGVLRKPYRVQELDETLTKVLHAEHGE